MSAEGGGGRGGERGGDERGGGGSEGSGRETGGAEGGGAAFDLTPEEFRRLGHRLVDDIAEFYATLPGRALTRAPKPSELRALLPNELPREGSSPAELLAETSRLLFDWSLHNGHPRFMGYITSSAAPLGALADLLAAAVNANVGLWDLAPAATEIEAQCIRWLAELVGYPADCGGLMVSGGNMANIVGLLAARRARAPWDVRELGLGGGSAKPTIYTSAEAHTWIEKATDIAGLGTGAIRRVRSDAQQRIDVADLERLIEADLARGCLPFLIVASAGTVATGAVDPLPEIAAVARRHGLWLHVDGAYGAPAAALPEAPDPLRALAEADSLALDPHKWLYSPLEAGCALVRDAEALRAAFSFRPDYYRLEADEAEPKINYYEHGMQNSRGFRALKVWLTLRRAGREGCIRSMRRNIAMARRLHEAAAEHPELEARTLNLSIATFRYRPPGYASGTPGAREYLNRLNEALLRRIQTGGEAFVSNAVVDGDYLLRACVVNFRTKEADIDALVDTVLREGRRCASEQGGTA